MQLNIQLNDEVLMDVLGQSLDGGFDHVEEYVQHLLVGITIGAIELVINEEALEDVEPLSVAQNPNELWTTEDDTITLSL